MHTEMPTSRRFHHQNRRIREGWSHRWRQAGTCKERVAAPRQALLQAAIGSSAGLFAQMP